MPALEHTSVPAWAVGVASVGSPALAGTSYLLVGVGPEGEAEVAAWASGLGDLEVTRVVGTDVEVVAADLAAALVCSTVGVRVWLTGPVAACLALRARAVVAGVEDDELYVAPLAAAGIDLWCVHCGTVSSVPAAIDDVVPCVGCFRNLLVYPHVSRRTGHFLGFQVDAEEGGMAAGEVLAS